MPSTTETKPAKKTLATKTGDDAEPRKTKPRKRANKASAGDSAAEESASRSESTAVDAPPSKAKSKTKPAKARAPASKKSTTIAEESPTSDVKPKAKKRAPKTTDVESPARGDAKKRAPKSDVSEPVPRSESKKRAPIDLGSAVLQALATNERMNQFLLESLDERAWTVPPPLGKGRTIAAIVSHVHNVRHMWLQVTSKGTPIPEKLDRTKVTKPEAMKALAKSSQALLALFERSLENGGRMKDFRPDVVGFLGYVIAHEAHHRGQICMQTRELGMPLSQDAGYGMWDWNKRWKECGFGG